MTLALVTAMFSAVTFLADSSGSLPSWVTAALTPTAIALLFISGQVVRGKDYEAAVKRAEEAEAREREAAKVTIPALETAARSMDQMMSYLKGKGS